MSTSMPEEKIVKTWHEIARWTPFSAQTLRKKYGSELKDVGVVFMVRLGSTGKRKRWTACAYPSIIMRYFAMRKWE